MVIKLSFSLICSNDRENNTAIATIHNFLVSHGKIARNPEIFQDHFEPPIPLRNRVRDYFEARDMHDNNIRRRNQNPPYVNWGRLVEMSGIIRMAHSVLNENINFR